MPSLFTVAVSVAVSVAVAMAGGYGYFVSQRTQRTQTPEALFESGKKYYEQKNYQEAMIQLENAVQKEPHHREARLLLSRVLAATGNRIAAATQLKALLEYYPDDPTGIQELTNLYPAADGSEGRAVGDTSKMLDDANFSPLQNVFSR